MTGGTEVTRNKADGGLIETSNDLLDRLLLSAVFSSERWKLHPDWVYCKYNYAVSDDRQLDTSTPENNMRHFLDRLSHEGAKFNWSSSGSHFCQYPHLSLFLQENLNLSEVI